VRPEFLQLLGGSALLVYSIGELSRSIQMLAGSHFRSWLNQSTKDRFRGMLLGVVLSMLLCSSGAVTAMLVSLANARLLSLSQTFAVSLGAGIGSTLMLQLLAFKVSEYGLLILASGFVIESVAGLGWMKRLGRVALFVGIVFYSLDMLVEAGEMLRQDPVFVTFSDYFRSHPLFGFVIAALFAAFTHSSSATVAFCMSLLVAQQGTLLDALPWIFGANLGTTATAYFASLGSDTLGRQAAMGSVLTRVAGVLLFWPLQGPIAYALTSLDMGLRREIALGHTLFNVVLAILFLPLLSWGVKLVKLLIPNDEDQGPFTFHYLDRSTLETPEIALAQAHRELLRLSEAVEKLLNQCLVFFQKSESQAVEEFRSNDKVIDFLNKGIKQFLTSLSQGRMTRDQVDREFEIIIRTNDMENIGDIIANNIVALIYKCHHKGYEFSNEGWNDIRAFHAKVLETLRTSTSYFSNRSAGLAKELQKQFEGIEALNLELTEKHLRRLHEGVKQSQESSSVHLDLLGHLTRIASLSVNILKVQGSRQAKQSAG
jgi:phosphate:Na+ symporter